jgi:hypothetical protein
MNMKMLEEKDNRQVFHSSASYLIRRRQSHRTVAGFGDRVPRLGAAPQRCPGQTWSLN